MIEAHEMTLLVGQLALLLSVGALLARGSEWLGQPRLVGALLAGVLLGPLVFGQVGPEVYEDVMVGAAEERAALRGAETETTQAIEAAEAIKVTETYVEQLKRQRDAVLAPLRADLARAEREAQAPLRWAVFGAIIVALLAVGRRGQMHRDDRPRYQAAAMGIVGIVICGVLACWLIPLFGFGPVVTVAEALPPHIWLMGAVIGCGATAAPWLAICRTRLGEGDAGLPQRESMLLIASLVTFVAAAFVAMAAIDVDDNGVRGGQLDWGSLAIVAGVTVVVLFTLLVGLPPVIARSPNRWSITDGSAGGVATLVIIVAGALIAMASGMGWHPAAGALVAAAIFSTQPIIAEWLDRTLGPIADYAAEPFVIAYIGTQLSIADFNPWLALLVLILFGDGKALGAMAVGWFAFKQSFTQAMRTGTAMATGGFIPLVVALLLRQAGIIDDPLFTSLVLANVICAVCAGPIMSVINRVSRSEAVPDTPSDATPQ